jgi:hypothetical protein
MANRGKRRSEDDEDNGSGAPLDIEKPATKKRKSTAITDCEHVTRDHYGKVSQSAKRKRNTCSKPLQRFLKGSIYM